MPGKYVIKQYIEDGYYHVFNRGVEKREIFLSRQDYIIFLNILRIYLTDPNSLSKLKDKHKNLYPKIQLLAYCLMPNHFHLLIHQDTSDCMTKLLRRVLTSYSIYFNNRYKRTGTLFEGRYKAILITNDDYLLYVSKYIHRNPIALQGRTLHARSVLELLTSYPFSSYPNYLHIRKNSWVNPLPILEYFSQNLSKNMLTYQQFVENENDYSPIDDLQLE